jgi:molecular chaperone DnaK
MQTVGIDLGTTNTVASVNATVLPLRGADGPTAPILPSVVAYLPDGDILVGAKARARRAVDVKNTVYSAKRVIGESWHSYRAREFAEHYPFDLIPTEDGQVGFRTRAGIRTATEVAGEIVRALSLLADMDPRGRDAVVTVPAAFGAAQRTATLQAVHAAGFARARTIAEPVATALAYLQHTNVRRGAVYDLGGGTFDFAIVDCSQEPFQLVAHGGDPYLGGDDIDRALASFVADVVLRKHGWDLRSDAEVFARLVLAAEQAKLQLSHASSAAIDFESVDPAAPLRRLAPVAIEQSALRELSTSLIRRTFVICDQVLGSAGLTARDIQAVFMAGGTTLVPGVRDEVARYFGPRLRYELDPMHVVSLGASIAAARPRFAPLLDEV